MKILAVSDQVVDHLYSDLITTNFKDVELVLGCGDLPKEYLEFIVTVLNVPMLYVPGNHDPLYDRWKPETQAEGCQHLDLRSAQVRGLSLAGIGGSIRYRPGPHNQYTQQEMYWRVLSLLPRLLLQRWKTGRNLDILITHSPPFGIHDESDPAHIGIKAFHHLLRILKPRYLLHGHTMVYLNNPNFGATRVDATTVINVNPYRLLDIEPHE